jgi:hypothetical protein
MKKVNIQFKFSNRFLYTFIVTVIMILVGVMVFAYTGNVGHTSSQIDESDPTVESSVKDGVSWSELSGIPSGFADGTDNVGTLSESDPTVTSSVKDGVSWSELSGIPSGFSDGVDNTGSGSVSWNSITGKPSGFADNVDNEGSVSWGEISGNYAIIPSRNGWPPHNDCNHASEAGRMIIIKDKNRNLCVCRGFTSNGWVCFNPDLNF